MRKVAGKITNTGVQGCKKNPVPDFFCFIFFVFIFSSIFLFACFQQSKTLFHNVFAYEETEGVSDTKEPEICELEIFAGSFFIADSIVSKAENYGLERNFSDAHYQIAALWEVFDVPETICKNTQAIFKRIARLYLHKFPHNYIDSIPENIRPFAAAYQFRYMLSKVDTTEFDMTRFRADCIQETLFNIPITYNSRVEEAMDFFLLERRHRRIIRDLNRMAYYRPFMVKMFEEAGIPTDLTYLPLLESAFDPHAYSSASASGLWQFISSTGLIYGLRENYWADERRDPIKSTAASIAYFKVLYDILGDWHLVLAAYNFGEPRVVRRMQTAREINPDTVVSFWDLQLPQETMGYIPFYIAYKIIAKNPECFGFSPDTSITPFPYDTVKVSSFMDMRKIARAVGISTDSLRKINPHLKTRFTPPDLRNVNLYLPPGTTHLYRRAYASFREPRLYRYKIGDEDSCIDGVARIFGTTAEAIRNANEMTNDTLIVGEYIQIPLPNVEMRQRGYRYRVAQGDNVQNLARRFSTTVEEIREMNRMINHSLLAVGGFILIPLPEDERDAQRMITRIRRYEESRRAREEAAALAAATATAVKAVETTAETIAAKEPEAVTAATTETLQIQ